MKAAVPAQRIFQSAAAGLLGKPSFEGGAATAALPSMGDELHIVVHILLIGVPIALATSVAARRTMRE